MCRAFQWGTGPATEMEMRRAVARAWTARMTAEGDGLALLVASIGVVAISTPQIDQGKVPRLDLDAAQWLRFGPFERRHRPVKPG